MVRSFSYRGEKFRATIHGRPGKEELFVVHMSDDGEEGAEISLDRFEDPNNDPSEPLDSKLMALVNQLLEEQNITPADASAGFAWSDAGVMKQVHSGVQHY